MTFDYGIGHLTVDKVIGLANGTLKGVMNKQAIDKVNACRKMVEKMAGSNKAVYGINTGFGPLCDVQITPAETSKLQEN